MTATLVDAELLLGMRRLVGMKDLDLDSAAQLLADHGGLFSSWQPYAPLKTFTYHFGYHADVAWLHWLSGTPTTHGVLIIGQLQSALVVPMTYLLARRTVGGERAGLSL